MTVKEKIDRLRAELHQHNYNYYVPVSYTHLRAHET